MQNDLSIFSLSQRSKNDAMAEYRPRIGALISALGSALLLPFIIVHAVQGRWGLSVLFGLTSMVLLVNVWAVYRKQRPFLPFEPVVAGLVLAVCASIWVQGPNGLTWAYPVLFIGFFILPRLWANILGLGLVGGVSITTLQSIGVELASRAAATLFLNFVMINLVLNVIDHLHDALSRQATIDPLTGAHNRRHFQKQLDAAVLSQNASPQALLMFDIDHFKRINDAYGHDTGDRVLQTVVLLSQTVIAEGIEVYRLGGEEFAVLLPNTGPMIALGIAEKLRKAIEAAPALPCQESAVTISIGVASFDPGLRADEWLKRADVALYEAKRQGRNCAIVWDRRRAHSDHTTMERFRPTQQAV